jgi:tRNA (guanosine-2'-O-)-methyltransferase
MFVSARRIERFRAVAAARLSCLTMVFDNITDGHNENACTRVADSFGIGEVHHLGDKAYRGNMRISKASDRWVDVRNWGESDDVVGHLRGAGFTLLGAVVPADGGVPHCDVALPARTAIVIGSARYGLSAHMRSACDMLVHIPTHGFVDSLNLSTAAAILAQHFSQRHRASGRDVFISQDAQAELVRRWIDVDLRAKLKSRGLTVRGMLRRELPAAEGTVPIP